MTDSQAEARLFLYDLANLAKEHWFKSGENWSLSLANEAEKAAILKQYYPTLHIIGETKTLEIIAEITRAALRLPTPDKAMSPERGAPTVPPTYLIAYNPARQRQ